MSVPIFPVSAVIVFGRESEAKGAGAAAQGVAVQVKEVEYKITLSTHKVKHGTVTFSVQNAGKIAHNLTIQGVNGRPHIDTNKQSAQDMGISIKTVANHRAHLMEKTGALNAADLTRISMIAGVR